MEFKLKYPELHGFQAVSVPTSSKYKWSTSKTQTVPTSSRVSCGTNRETEWKSKRETECSEKLNEMQRRNWVKRETEWNINKKTESKSNYRNWVKSIQKKYQYRTITLQYLPSISNYNCYDTLGIKISTYTSILFICQEQKFCCFIFFWQVYDEKSVSTVVLNI